MSHRVVPRIVVLMGLMAIVSGCATGRTGGLFSQQIAQVENPYTQQMSLARLAERHGNLSGSKKLYRGVLAESPQHPLALHRMGVIAGKEGEYDHAIEYLTQASAAAGPTAEIYSDLGYVYYLQDNHELARQSLEKSLELDPDYAAARTNLGIVYAELGDDDRALQEFRRTLSEAEALSNLAYIQSQRGDLQLAEKNFVKALDINKNLRPAAEALVQLAAHAGQIAPQPQLPPAAAPRPAPPEMVAQVAPEPASAAIHPTPPPAFQPQADALTDNPLRSTARFAPAQMASIDSFRPASLEQAAPAPQVSRHDSGVTPVQYTREGSSTAAAVNTTTPVSNQANGGLVIPTQDLGTMPAVYQISDQPGPVSNNELRQPPIAASQIGSVQSASAKTFSQEIMKALQSASSP